MRPGMHYLKGTTDRRVHACPHVNARSITVFDAVRSGVVPRRRPAASR